MSTSLTLGVSSSQTTLQKVPRKCVLILLSDTGGGHRASAGAIQDALTHLYGSDALEIIILDIWTDYGRWPFNSFVSVYRFASENPWCWKVMYESSRSPISRSLFLSSGYAVSGGNFAPVFEDLRPDLVISVHPLCQHVPLQILEELRVKTGYTTPFVTVVTDLGACHPTWFHPKASRIYVPSKSVMDLALSEGIREEQLRLFGLPLRMTFWTTPTESRDTVRDQLQLAEHYPTCLVVGGGEGVGGIDNIAMHIAKVFMEDSREVLETIRALGDNRLDASILEEDSMDSTRLQVVIVCGKNEHTRLKVLKKLEEIQQQYGSKHVHVDDRTVPYGRLSAVNTNRERAVSDLDEYPEHSTKGELALPKSKLTRAQKVWNEFSKALFGSETHIENSRHLSSIASSLRDGRGRRSRGDSVEALSNIDTENADLRTLSEANFKRRRAKSDDSLSLRNLMDQYKTCHDTVLLKTYQRAGTTTVPACDAIPKQFEWKHTLPLEAENEQSVRNNSFVHSSKLHKDNPRLRLTVFGFADNMDELMAASDLIVTKAGPGTIAEAMTRGLPILLSSYMPGQEEGNISFVLEGNFGAYCVDPQMIGVIVREWLTNPRFQGKLINMRRRSRAAANPTASIDIARDLGFYLNLPIVTSI